MKFSLRDYTKIELQRIIKLSGKNFRKRTCHLCKKCYSLGELKSIIEKVDFDEDERLNILSSDSLYEDTEYLVCKNCEDDATRLNLIRGWIPCTRCIKLACCGYKCRIGHGQNGLLIHCKSCFGEDHEDTHVDGWEKIKDPQMGSADDIWCDGFDCHIHRADGLGVHCRNCFDVDDGNTVHVYGRSCS